MKIAIITDTHFGIRNDSPLFYKHFDLFYSKIFFPKLREEKIDTILHLGDLVDRRKYINFRTAKHMRKCFIEPIVKQGMRLITVVGNHDCFYKNTNSLNAIEELVKEYPIELYTKPTEIDFDGVKFLLMPWICLENEEESFNAIKTSSAPILAGHLELNGFEMQKGSVAEEGMDSGIFTRFEQVFSGHFHHRSTRGNIHYLGAPVEFTWADYDDPRGFSIFDTSNRLLEFVENPYKVFHKIFYNDEDRRLAEVVDSIDYKSYAGCTVKVIIIKKTNQFWFDQVLTKLEEVGVDDLRVVDDNMNLDAAVDSEIIEESNDTLKAFISHVETMSARTDRQNLINFITSLYNEAYAVT